MTSPGGAATDSGFGETGRDVSRYVRVSMREVEGTGHGPVLVGHAPVSEHLRGPNGGVRGGALLTMLDNVGGLCGGLAALPDGWVVSTNLSARSVRFEHVGPFRIDARVLRQGRASVVTAVQIRDEGAADALVMEGALTSAILVPKNGPPKWDRPLAIDPGELSDDASPRVPEWLGVQVVDSLTLEMPLRDTLRNPWGILHGGAVASLIDCTAEHVTGGITTDVVLHFLAPNRVGPVRARVEVIGTPPGRHGVARRGTRRRRGARHRVGSGDLPRSMSDAGAACFPGRSTRRRSRTSRLPKPRCKLVRSITSTSRSRGRRSARTLAGSDRSTRVLRPSSDSRHRARASASS